MSAAAPLLPIGRRDQPRRPAGAAPAARPDSALATLAVVIVAAIAASLRLAQLTQFGFNTDEAVYSGQAAALAGNQQYTAMFGVFRAHPLLVHFLVSLIYRVTGINDVAPRVLSAVFGIALVLVVGAVALVAYGRLAGLIAMAFAAVTPYAVTVSRQMLLDGPMAFFAGLTILFLALYVRRPHRILLYSAAAAAGLAFLAKESAVLIIPAVIVFMLLARDVPFRLRDIAITAGVYVLTVSPFPLSLLLGGGTGNAQQFFVWQILRRANHDPAFYWDKVVPSVGLPIILLAIVGLGVALWRRRGIDVLIVALCLVTIGFFELWPVKGFQYLIPVVTPTVILAALGVIWLGTAVGAAYNRIFRLPPRTVIWAARTAVVAASVGVLAIGSVTVVAAPAPTLLATDSSDDLTQPAYGFVAGTGGLKASRPVGVWIKAHTLPNSRFMTIGPSFANIIQFYGERRAVALAVSPNPLHRNPSYTPIENPDKAIKTGAIQYLVYDSYTASRTKFFTSHLLSYVAKYKGILVYADYQPVHRADGTTKQAPVVLIYEVHP